jgi:hypothetical protein
MDTRTMLADLKVELSPPKPSHYHPRVTGWHCNSDQSLRQSRSEAVEETPSNPCCSQTAI